MYTAQNDKTQIKHARGNLTTNLTLFQIPPLKTTTEEDNENTVSGGVEKNNSTITDNDKVEEDEDDELIIGILTELAEENFQLVEQYTDYEHVELEREKLDPTKGFKRKRQTAIIEHFKMMDKTANDKIAPDNIENNKRIESYKRKIFMGRNGTLNDRLGAGITAGNKWYENFLLNEELSSKDKDIGKDSEKIIQDFTKEPVLIGADVQALYPNLDGLCVAKIAANAVRETKVKFSGINYYFLTVYLLLVLGFEGMHRNGLGECIPRRKKKSNARSLASLNNRDMNNWDFTKVKLTPDLKIELLAMMIQVAVLAMTSTTCYSFAGNLYKQKKGLGIGLRASACLARICMCKWDQLWSFYNSR